MLAKDKPLPPTANHRYMTREQILEKLEREKLRRLSEERQRKRIQSQMLEMEEEDHNDMVEMMSHVNKDDVPEDMLLFWDEQKRSCKRNQKARTDGIPSKFILRYSKELKSVTAFNSFHILSCRFNAIRNQLETLLEILIG